MAIKTVIVELRDQNDEPMTPMHVSVVPWNVRRQIMQRLAGETVVELKKQGDVWTAKIAI